MIMKATATNNDATAGDTILFKQQYQEFVRSRNRNISSSDSSDNDSNDNNNDNSHSRENSKGPLHHLLLARERE